ncbi:MAG: S8 family serine peptidase [Gammaproteobacteria bacterium]|nr:S8 family serine peptidase [Gammaproteobacteria bacterium]
MTRWWLVAGLSCVAGGLVVYLVVVPDSPPTEVGEGDAYRETIEAAVAAIAAESQGRSLDPVIEAAPLASQTPVDLEALPAEMPPRPPEGYSFVGFHGEMSKERIDHLDARGPETVDDGFDWLGSPNAVDALVAQAVNAGRDWTFGWIRLADDARPGELAKVLEGSGVEVIGSAGRMIRARLPGDSVRLASVARLPGVDGLGALPAAEKLRAFEGSSTEARLGEPVPVFVTLMADDVDGRWRRQLEAIGAVVGRYDATIRVYTANVTSGVLDALAAADFILAVEPVGVVEPAHDTAVPAMGADALRVHGGSPGIFRGSGGASVPIGVMDTGLNINHPDIGEHRASICATNLVWFDASANDADLWVDARHHGTHVTGTIAGNGFLAPRFAGMAPSVRDLRFAKVLRYDTGTGYTDSVHRAMDFLARESSCADSDAVRPLIVNMSLSGSSVFFVGRDVNARKLDATVWQHRQLYVVAQSNEAAEGFSNYAAAKNSLSVGALLDDGHVATFSSHGPTYDGRLAPQVGGTGVGVCSTEGNGKGAGYVCLQGTSMAAPSVAGVAALLLDANPDYQSEPALARARLMASAVRPDPWLESEAAFPSTNTDGPGSLQRLYGMGKVSARTAVLDRDEVDGWTGGGAVADVENEDEYVYSDIVVPEGASRLDVVMTWDEPPTEAFATPVLNDLDLWLDRDADCNDGACGEQSSVSRIDNVEWIVVRDPQPGTYRAKVVPQRIYTEPPKAAISWTVIRGSATPSLRMTVDETPLEENRDERRVEVGVDVTADAYVAAGVRLHLECRGQGSDCDALTVAGATVEREDGLSRTASGVVREFADYPRNERRSPVHMATGISLGEIAVGEVQSVALDVVYAGTGPVHLYLVASAWNGQGTSQAIAISPSGGHDDQDVTDPLGQPANDRFANAERLSASEGAITVDLLRATSESAEPALRSDFGRPFGSLWYEWTAPSTDLVRFGVATASRASMDAHLDVYRGDRIAGLEHVAANRRVDVVSVTGDGYPMWGTIFTDAVFFAQKGDVYRVRLAHGEPSLPLVLRWRQGPRPGNDDFLDAEALTGLEGSVDGTNLGATLETGESLGPAAATTWYRWTAPEDGQWQFGVESDRVLRVVAFRGIDVGSLRLVSGFPATEASFAARGGDEYRIAVASPNAYLSGGSYRLSWEQADWTPDPGDHFADAGVLGSFFSLGGHTVEPGEPEGSGVRTQWWSWTAPETGSFTWKLESQWTELQVAGFTGNDLASLDLVARKGPDVTAREFSFAAEQGERYWLSVGWPADDYGAYTSSIAYGFLYRGPTPSNDEFDAAIALGSTRGLTWASNTYATTAPDEPVEQFGHSTLWWTYEAPTPGWYEFYTTDTQPVLAVFEVEETGTLREISRAVDGSVVFLAEPGKRYAIRTSRLHGSYGGSLGLHWRPAAAPAWLRYVGSFADAEDAAGETVQMIDGGSLAFDGKGATLYAVSALGLTTYARDDVSGRLRDGVTVDDDLSGGLLVHDPERDRLIANDCGTWRVYTAAGSADAEGRDLDVDGDPASCGHRLFLGPEGEFLYRVVAELGIDVFAVEAAGLRYVETTQLAGIKDAVVAPKGDYVYAVSLAACGEAECDVDFTSHLRTFRRDQEDGVLTLQRRFWYFYSVDDLDTLAISDDERLFVTRKSTGWTAMYELAEGVLSRVGDVSLLSQADLSVHLARPFVLASARSGAEAVDVFGANVAVGLEIDQGEVDLLANGQMDRFGTRVPLFGAPSGLAASLDGRHVYVSSYQHGIVAFERVGAGVEAEDPHVRLDVLEVSSGTISFAAEMDSDACIAVADLEHDGVTYTVQSSKWQWRSNADWPWTDVAGTVSTGELCPHEPGEPGHYRLVVEMEVDGAARQHASNVLVQDDHGDSVEEATTIGLPSATAGWLDPGDDDYFRIEVEQPGQLTIHSEGWINAEGRLLDGEGDLIASDSDGAVEPPR